MPPAVIATGLLTAGFLWELAAPPMSWFHPLIPLLIVSYLAITWGARAGARWGFVTGLIVAGFNPGWAWWEPLSYTLLGWAIGRLARWLARAQWEIQFVTMLLTVPAYLILTLVCQRLTGRAAEVATGLIAAKILTTTVASALAVVPLLWGLRRWLPLRPMRP